MYIIKQDSSTPLHIQLYEELKKDIIDNFEVGHKLESIRKIASTYNLSKNTVESAYSQLYAEGYIESFPKKGYFVSDLNSDNLEVNTSQNNLVMKEKPKYKYDFKAVQLPKDSFPLKLWKRLYSKAIDDTLDFGSYPDGQGEIDLRIEIAKYLNHSRGANCHPDQIVITSGFGDSMVLLAKMIKDRYKSFAIEDPGYYIARSIFEDFNYSIARIGVDHNGLILNKLEKSDSKIVYITPSHQYPKGVTMPIANRQKLLEWANKVNGLIIEDDYDSELTYYNRPIPCLQGLDKDDRVVYLGTFAKAFSPALRVSYMLLPNHLLPIYEKQYDKNFCKVSLDTQKTLALFMKEGHFDKQLRKIRALNKKKHDLLKKLLKDRLGKTMKIEVQGAGLAIFINPTMQFDWDKFKKSCLEKSVKVYFAKDVSGGNWDAIRLGFGGFDEEKLEEAVDAFSEVWYKCLT
jgi:GntR family transcriptional regulator/MocR family aminotransferase